MDRSSERDRVIVEAAATAGATANIAAISLTNFKALNALVGYDEGNQILARLEDHLASVSLGSWRTGGDEFVALLAGDHRAATALMRALSWLFHIRVHATVAWRLTCVDARWNQTIPCETLDAAMTPRCGLVPAGDAAAALELARQRCMDHLHMAHAAGWCEVDEEPWIGFAPLSRGFSNRRSLATPACPRCHSAGVLILAQDLEGQTEECPGCGLAWERDSYVYVRGAASSF